MSTSYPEKFELRQFRQTRVDCKKNLVYYWWSCPERIITGLFVFIPHFSLVTASGSGKMFHAFHVISII